MAFDALPDICSFLESSAGMSKATIDSISKNRTQDMMNQSFLILDASISNILKGPIVIIHNNYQIPRSHLAGKGCSATRYLIYRVAIRASINTIQ